MRNAWKVIVITLAALVLMGGLVSLGFVAGYGVSSQGIRLPIAARSTTPTVPASGAPAGTREEQFSLFWEAWDLLQAEFYGDLPDIHTGSRAAVRGLIQSLGDPHTALLDPEMAKLINEDISGQLEGIGANVRTDENGFLVVVQPFAGGPAARAGVLPGDIVLEVDGHNLEGLSTTEAIVFIRGPKGTTATLLIFRPSTQERLTIAVVRDKIDIPNIEARIVGDSIAYIRLREFNAMSVDQMHEALRTLLATKPTGLILDLRGNPGGLLDAAIRIGSEFVGEGNITEERAKDGTSNSFAARRGGLATNRSLPLIVLVDQGSASASEIVAGAIQDTGRGRLLGQTTYGKGSVQIPRSLSDGSQLRITVAHWFTPKGRDINKEGLAPDEVVPLTVDDFRAGKDPQLDRAIQVLQEQSGSKSTAQSGIWHAIVS